MTADIRFVFFCKQIAALQHASAEGCRGNFFGHRKVAGTSDFGHPRTKMKPHAPTRIMAKNSAVHGAQQHLFGAFLYRISASTEWTFYWNSVHRKLTKC